MLRNLKQFNLPEIEEKVLKSWKENQIFEKAAALRSFDSVQDKQVGKKTKTFRFFEGPPTANGRPGIHHVLSRAFKDIVLRYKTMRGYFVRRKAGWDTHGLPIEIEVEKELGLKNKQEIEKFGIAEFNEKAKLSVWKYQDEWEKLTDRIGYWLDLKNPYITYKSDYIESLWWIFKQIAKRGLLERSFKIVPYCPRCQTPLSTHEMGQPGVYKKVKDPSIYIKFEIKNQKSKIKNKEYLLVWTTTPWTLPSNVAIAVNPSLIYTKYRIGKEYFWSYNAPPSPETSAVAKALADKLAGKSAWEIEVVEKVSGKKLVGLNYKPLFKVKGPWLKNKKFFKVYGADFVSTEEGTGLVHIAPAFGEDDMNLIRKYQKKLVGQIPITIDEKGIAQKGIPGAGKPAKIADKDIIQDLEQRGILLKSDMIEHDYPFCWRCNTALLYFSQFSWFIEMSRLQKELISNNQKINWVPEHIKEGRFGEWLREVKDWAISRNRYWGTPLPIWECSKCSHQEIIGSLKDLDDLRFSNNNFFLLRHGEAEHNLKDVIAAGPEEGTHISKLTEKGKKDAEKAGQNLKKMLGKKKLEVIYASPYARTKETAKIVAKATEAKIIIDKRLSELNCGIFNWRKIQEHKNFFSDPLEEFTKTPPGGEDLTDVKKRMFQAILDINKKYQNKNILIVGHGDPLWVLEGAMKGLSNEEILKLDYIRNNGEVRKVVLHNWPYNSDGEVDLHRPYIDEIHLQCKKCGKKMERVKEVADVWFDSGAMPFAQFHYPFGCAKRPTIYDLRPTTLKECIDFPADYISEGVDQTRGWFYTLLAVSTALELEIPPYLNVICLGLVLDKNGQKMSKSKSNVVNPWDMIQKYGADILRWYFYTINAPGESKCFDEADLRKMFRKFIMIIYNSFVFFDTYATKNLQPTTYNLQPKHILDRWILARLNEVILKTTEKLDIYDIGGAAKEIEIFVDDLSRWYIRRSRSRFQKPVDIEDFKFASFTLHHCLLELSKLIAPFTPFFAEALFMSLNNELGIRNRENNKFHNSEFMIHNSVHLQDWPANKKDIDYSLLKKMTEARRLASLALALRAEKGIKVRQPLKTLEIKSSILDVRDEAFINILKDEINVKEVKWNLQMKENINLDTAITPELREEGLLRDVVRMVQGLRHDANYIPKDKIVLMIKTDPELGGILDKNTDLLKKEVNAEYLDLKRSEKFDAELDSEIDDRKIWIGVRKI
jgi:isoleucyl-tRNA synthetase